ncbi:MAG: hypothetical protein JNK02_13100 [Planctomycetes bacterium]|nr:hypothetical protein [Planctomycetota bacterium]
MSLEALRGALGRPAIWLVILLFEVLLALGPALAWFAWMSAATANRYEPGSLVSNLGANFRFDHRAGLGALGDATGQVGAALALVAMLAGCFIGGGWLQVFLERTHGESARRFFHGGARWFWRFARLLLVTLALLAGVGWVVFGKPWNVLVLQLGMNVPPGDFERLETLGSEQTVVALRFAQAALHAGLVALVLAWGDYTRTRLALHDTNSAVWAGLQTAWTITRHPIRTLRPLAALFLLEAFLLTGLGFFARSVEGDLVRQARPWETAVLCATVIAALVWRVILRGARYHAAVQVSREIVRPIARPDPWRKTLGGPGGPRYPIGGDEYTVSM